MSNPQLSSILEIVSFFFVTIDLYGKERLSASSEKLMNSIEWVNEKIDFVREIKWQEKKNRSIMLSFYALATLLASVGSISIILEDKTQDESFLQVTGSFILFTALLFVLALLVILLFSAVTIAAVLAISWLSKQIINYMIKLLSILNFEGLLLAFGAVLFLISKYIDY